MRKVKIAIISFKGIDEAVYVPGGSVGGEEELKQCIIFF